MLKKIYMNELVKKNYIVIIEECSNKCSMSELGAVMKSFSSLGYTLDKESILMLSKLSTKALRDFYLAYFPLLKEIKGVNVKHTIFYRNFPEIGDISDDEMYVRAVLHYLTSNEDDEGFMNQDLEDFIREEVHNENKITLKIINKDEAIKIIVKIARDLFMSKNAIPYYYEDFLKQIIKDYGNQLHIDEIPFKENIAVYISILLPNGKKMKLGEVLSYNSLRFVKTFTDLLRVYAVLSKGDITLQNNVKFISLDRKCRRLFMSILDEIANNSPYCIDDLARHEFLFKKAFEKLHVGEYKDKYPLIRKIVKDFRNDEYLTFYGKLEMLKDDQKAYLSLLKTRPGEFARRLDSIIRNPNYDLELSLKEFLTISDKVSTTVLLSLYRFYLNRNSNSRRVVKIKKNYNIIFHEFDDTRLDVKEEIVNKVLETIKTSLINIYSSYPFQGKVYLDESLKNYSLPINSRNASSQNKTLTYGTKIKLKEEDKKYLRFFTHFRNMKEGNNKIVDIDLSIEFVNEDLTESFSLSWHDLGSGKRFDSFHSGDIITAPDGASEFIDLNYMQAREYARYAVVTNSVYTGQDFADIPECFSGVIFLDAKGRRGKVFNPEFVEYKFDLTQKGSNQNIAFALDLETLELIWLDTPFYYHYSNIIASGNSGIIYALMDALKKSMNMYDFFLLHKNHMEIVEDKEEADIIISDQDDATIRPFDVEIISALWL